MSTHCNNNHKYGPWINITKGFQRTCFCCHKITTYPQDENIAIEIQKQNETEKLLSVILEPKIDLIQSNDDFINLISCIMDSLSYIYLDKEAMKKCIEHMSILNNQILSQEPEKHNIIQNFIDFLTVYFKKEEAERKFGLAFLDEEYYRTLDTVHNNIINQINSLLDNANTKTTHPTK